MQPPVRDALLLTLTAAAGSTDAVSYLGLQRVFTANMTGNLVLLGAAIGQGQLAGSLRSVLAFAAFGAGVLAGARLTAGSDPKAVWPQSVTKALVIELGLLTALVGAWEIAGSGRPSPAVDILIVLAASSMGMQTAAARRLSAIGITTTFVTGTMTSLVADLAAGVPNRARVTRWASTLASLVAGAAGGAAVLVVWRPGAPLLALLLVGIATAVAMWPAQGLTPSRPGDGRPPP